MRLGSFRTITIDYNAINTIYFYNMSIFCNIYILVLYKELFFYGKSQN